ncbi:hypothetical protein [Clostridium sp. Marseille-QA1073]
MAMIINNNCDGSTQGGLEFFKRYKDAFGNVISVEMHGKKDEAEYKLVLINDKNEEIHLINSCSCGYWGEGPRGTYDILKLCGFSITKEFIMENESFKFEK